MDTMYKYHFKIRKNETELEFSTDDVEEFDKRVLDWVNGICYAEQQVDSDTSSHRMDFIDIKNLVKVKDMSSDSDVEEKETFEEVLESSIKSPKVELEQSIYLDNDLYKLFNSKNPKDLKDYLIITAYYMVHYENILHFSLKQVNSRIVPLKKEAITHSIVDAAIKMALLEILPDLTGQSEITEYTLTQIGEDYYNNL